MAILRGIRVASNDAITEKPVAWLSWPDDPSDVAWFRQLGISASKRVYLSPCLIGMPDHSILFAALVEDIPFVTLRDHTYFPADWLAKTTPDLAESLNRIAAAVLRRFDEDNPKKEAV